MSAPTAPIQKWGQIIYLSRELVRDAAVDTNALCRDAIGRAVRRAGRVSVEGTETIEIVDPLKDPSAMFRLSGQDVPENALIAFVTVRCYEDGAS